MKNQVNARGAMEERGEEEKRRRGEEEKRRGDKKSRVVRSGEEGRGEARRGEEGREKTNLYPKKKSVFGGKEEKEE
jgi:hypothetical protein